MAGKPGKEQVLQGYWFRFQPDIPDILFIMDVNNDRADRSASLLVAGNESSSRDETLNRRRNNSLIHSFSGNVHNKDFFEGIPIWMYNFNDGTY